jgi:hypothetical protein
MATWDLIVLWIGGVITLMIFSFLYKDNPFYKFAEHLFVGVSAAFWMVKAIQTTMIPNMWAAIWPKSVTGILHAAQHTEPNLIRFVPLVLGLLLLSRLVPKIAWLSRWAMAVLIGFTSGTYLVRYLQSDFIAQIRSTIIPLVVLTPQGLDVMQSLLNCVLVFGVLCALVYFFFSWEHRGVIGGVSRVGIWILMIAFGASFGYTVMARISLLIGRIDYLSQWLQSFGNIF